MEVDSSSSSGARTRREEFERLDKEPVVISDNLDDTAEDADSDLTEDEDEVVNVSKAKDYQKVESFHDFESGLKYLKDLKYRKRTNKTTVKEGVKVFFSCCRFNLCPKTAYINNHDHDNGSSVYISSLEHIHQVKRKKQIFYQFSRGQAIYRKTAQRPAKYFQPTHRQKTL